MPPSVSAEPSQFREVVDPPATVSVAPEATSVVFVTTEVVAAPSVIVSIKVTLSRSVVTPSLSVKVSVSDPTPPISVSAVLPTPAVSVLALAPPLMTSATVPFVDAVSPPVIELASIKVRAVFPASLVSVSAAFPVIVTVLADSAVRVRVSTVVPATAAAEVSDALIAMDSTFAIVNLPPVSAPDFDKLTLTLSAVPAVQAVLVRLVPPIPPVMS